MLCFGLTIFAPWWQGRVAVTAFRNAAASRVDMVTLYRLSAVAAIYGGMAILSFVAGVLLWREDRRGIAVAKAYLLVEVVVPTTLSITLRVAGLHLNLSAVVAARLAHAAVWYAYLLKSRRVKATYELINPT